MNKKVKVMPKKAKKVKPKEELEEKIEEEIESPDKVAKKVRLAKLEEVLNFLESNRIHRVGQLHRLIEQSRREI